MDASLFKDIRKEVAFYMRRLYERGLTTSSGGNISIKNEDMMFITPTSYDKGMIRGRHIGIITMDGKNLTTDLQPSMESAMHLAIYKKRRDVNAIVHAHPPVATSFTAMDQEINCALIAEARALLGKPAYAHYALMGTKELAAFTADAAEGNALVIMLSNHGVVCLGKDLLTAFERMEVLESAANMTILTSMLGGVKPLSEEQIREIDRLML
jgi:L-fuculose-phosphate aldolase